MQRIDFDLANLERAALDVLPRMLLETEAEGSAAVPVLASLRAQLEAEIERRATGGTGPAAPLDLELAGVSDQGIRDALDEAGRCCFAFLAVRSEAPCAIRLFARIAYAVWDEAHARGLHHRLRGSTVLPWN